MLNQMANVNETLVRIPYKTCQLKDDYANYTLTDRIAMYVKKNEISLLHFIHTENTLKLFYLKCNIYNDSGSHDCKYDI